VGRKWAGDVDGPYTWWSWRGKAFDNDSGWRIDYQLATGDLAASVTNYAVDRAAAYDERWSDHTPVVVDYTL
jgi:exodeoxyribonuclease-3